MNLVLIGAGVVYVNGYLNVISEGHETNLYFKRHTSTSMSESLIPKGSFDQIASDLYGRSVSLIIEWNG